MNIKFSKYNITEQIPLLIKIMVDIETERNKHITAIHITSLRLVLQLIFALITISQTFYDITLPPSIPHSFIKPVLLILAHFTHF